MRKQIPEQLPLKLDLDEEMTTEMIELTCDELQGLSRAFEMISTLCSELQSDIELTPDLDIPENEIH